VTNASLSFLPWVRQGAASAITTVDSLASAQPAVTSVAAAVTLNNATVPNISVRLRGPADVMGIDPNQVVRTDPSAATTDFEPNCFPAIEFDRPDFPWLFTPAAAAANARLRPWLCLIVLRKQDGVSFLPAAGAPLPSVQIAAPAQVAVELPDLSQSWAWAHAQVAADDTSAAGLTTALGGSPELSLSRLICPRILAPDTDYIACVVPTFELGRKAGLGLPIADTDLVAANALAPAWVVAPPPTGPVTLPVYYQWSFRTGQGGDFESLVRRLQPAVVPTLGVRTVDASHPGFAAGGATTVPMPGALQPIPPAGAPAETAVVPPAFKTNLAAIVNRPDVTKAANPTADPLLAPPLYGSWHAAQPTISPTATSWLDQLNLDPRWRAAAAFGTQVVQQNQNALMASAWDQAADLASANQRMRQFQLGLAVGTVLHKRHLSRLTPETVLRVAAPAFGRLKQITGQSLLVEQSNSVLPIGANRSAMRRVGRLRGPLTRRIQNQGFSRQTTWITQLNTLSPALPPQPPQDVFCTLPALPVTHLQADSYFGAFFVAAERQPVTAPGIPFLVTGRTEIPGFFRAAAIEHMARFFVSHRVPPHTDFIIFQDVTSLVTQQMLPDTALKPLMGAVLATGSTVLAPTAAGVPATGTETVMAAPSFPQPMYEPLRDLSQDLLLPGLETVPPDTVAGLETNRRFVESYMVGLNHEMGRELLWQGFPTDQRGTYFAHFWGQGVPNTAPPDITDINTWGQRSLGASAATAGEDFVMLIRSSLLVRYPNAVIYLAPAIVTGGSRAPDEDPTHEKMPMFTGAMQPDVSFFGFPVTVAAATGADGGPGWFVVIQEHPTEPRFGLDVGINVGSASHLAIGATPPPGLALNGRTWGKNAGEMAGITRRLPVRIAVHAALLISHA
jgi:hypothetical protein